MGGVPIDYNLREPLEQGFTYDRAWDAFQNAPLKEARVKGDVGRNTFANLGGRLDAFIHTHPRWAKPEPGPEDFGHKVPMFGIHEDRIWVIYPGERRARQLWP